MAATNQVGCTVAEVHFDVGTVVAVYVTEVKDG